MLYNADCLEQLRTLDADSVDSLVTDPPAGISFMGKEWDGDKGGRSGWIAWMAEVMRECHRVMKPGAHGLVWAIPRTSHWTATALEDAGFEVRDVITHLFGQGFPKSLDISKAIEKAAGAERKVIGKNPHLRPKSDGKQCGYSGIQSRSEHITLPSTDAAKQWAGWGTALKPASEHWILVRKPCAEKTVAANVLEWGTGGINIDASRIEAGERTHIVWDRRSGNVKGNKFNLYRDELQGSRAIGTTAQGRFPANLVLSHTPYCTDEQCDIECAILALDAQSGTLKSGERKAGYIRKAGSTYSPDYKPDNRTYKADSGGASRFFYCAKISTSERNAGLEEFPDRQGGIKNSSGRGYSERDPHKPITVKNHHPTVKPQKLMRYLCRLITPPGGTVLDPFMGSGSTGMAARSEGFEFIGIERDPEYFKIAQARIGAC
jgi:DNA modification methylase